MNNSKNDKQLALDRLTAALVDDILGESDQALLMEVREAGEDPTTVAAQTRKSYERALSTIKKGKLLAAKAALQAERRADPAVVKLDPAAARSRLNALLSQSPEAKANLTLAARKGEGLSDEDVQSLLEDLEELGIRLPHDEHGGGSS